LTTSTEGAAIRYTLNGTTPTATSTLYLSPITISETKTLRAIALKTGWTNSDILTETYTITLPEKVIQPEATPAEGTYPTAQTVLLTSVTTGADIHYTLDGTTPTTGSTKYSSPITISETKTLKAIAVKADMTNSDILTETYTITPPGKVVQPLASPTGGSYTLSQTVTLTSATTGADIHYTLDGTTPVASSAKYSSPISIGTITTLKAIAVKSDMTNSDILTETYTIVPAQVIQPTATPAGGSYTSAQTVTLSTATTGATIRYTLDGTDPTTSSSLYSLSISIRETTTLKAIALKAGMTNSDILAETYTITTAEQPSASPPGGSYVLTQTVTLTTTTPNAAIHYTIDGSDPTTSSPLYVSPITIDETTTLKAIAIKAGLSDSSILTATYNIGYTVTFNADGGTPAPASPVTMKPGNSITQPPTMTKAWHTFGGWYTNSTYTTSALFPITVNNNVNLYARWILNTLTSVNDVKDYLASLPVNTKDNPANLTVNINLGDTEYNSDWGQLLNTINTADRYVDLDLSVCTMSGTVFNPNSRTTGRDKIVSITLPTVATSFKNSNAFQYYSSLKYASGASITFGSSPPFVEYSSFFNCTSLQSVEFPQVTYIPSQTFEGCTSLQNVSFPQVTSIGAGAFKDCTSLQNVNFPQLIEIGGINSFEGCTSLQSVSFPLATGISGFRGCTSLQTVSFPKAKYIYPGAFEGCINLQSVNIPASMNNTYYDDANITDSIIYDYSFLNPFAGCTSLTSITLSGSGFLSVIEDGKALVWKGNTLVAYPSASGVVISTLAITSIGGKAFSGCSNLQSISLPQVTRIGGSAFDGCTSLQNAYFPQVTTINSSIFSKTGTTTLSITMGSAAPMLDSRIFDSISDSKTVMVKIPTGATGYSPASSPFTGTTVTVSGTNTTANWGNGLRGGGWNGTALSSSSYINQNISVIIERQ
jgi:hypothetical protein